MEYEKAKAAEKLSNLIRSATKIELPQGNMESVVAALGGEIIHSNPEYDDEMWIEPLNNGFRILIGTECYKGQRQMMYAIALGYLFIHMGMLLRPEKWAEDKVFKDSPRQWWGWREMRAEARFFAGCLLMPEMEYRRVARETGTSNEYHVDKIAEHFDVSLDDALRRGRWLQMFAPKYG